MDNQQLRIQQLEQQNLQWQAWYQAQQMPQQQTPQYQTLPQLQLKPVQPVQPPQPPVGKKKKKAVQQTKKASFSQAQWTIILVVIGLIALRIIWVSFTANPSPSERQRTKITAR